MMGSVLWLHTRFDQWIVPDLWVWQLLFLSFAPVIYWGCKPALWRKVYLISAIGLGAFYAIAQLPIDDAEIFCQWLLESFSHNGQ